MHQDAVVAHDHDLDLGVGEQLRAALALLLEGQPAIVGVDHLRGLKNIAEFWSIGGSVRIGQRGEHRRVDRMHMHDAARMRHVAVDRAVQAPGGRVRRVRAGHASRDRWRRSAAGRSP